MSFTDSHFGSLVLIHFHCQKFLNKKFIDNYNEKVNYKKYEDNIKLGNSLLEKLHLELGNLFIYCDDMTEKEIDVILKVLYQLSIYIMYLGMEESAYLNESLNNSDFIEDCKLAGEQYKVALYFIDTNIYSKFEDYEIFKTLKIN